MRKTRIALLVIVLVALSYLNPWRPSVGSVWAMAAMATDDTKPKASATDQSLGPCDPACQQSRVDSKAIGEQQRREALKSASACLHNAMACVPPHFEAETIAGPWITLGVLDKIQIGMGFGSQDQGDLTTSRKCDSRVKANASLQVRIGNWKLGDTFAHELVNGSKATLSGRGSYTPTYVLAYRWLRHEHYLIGQGSAVHSGQRRLFNSDWEMQVANIGNAGVFNAEHGAVWSDGEDTIERLVYPRLGLPEPPRKPRVSSAWGESPTVTYANEAGFPELEGCKFGRSAVPPTQLPGPETLGATPIATISTAGTVSFADMGHTRLMAGACLGGGTITTTVTDADGKKVAVLEIQCGGKLSQGIAFPGVGAKVNWPLRAETVVSGEVDRLQVYVVALPL